MALLKALCWTLIFIIRIRFPPGTSLATVIKKQLFNHVARDVPGGKRILIKKINAQHNALSKAIQNKI